MSSERLLAAHVLLHVTRLQHLCRSAANGGCRDELKDPSPSPRSRSMTPKDRGRSPTLQEKLARWPKVDNLEKGGGAVLGV